MRKKFRRGERNMLIEREKKLICRVNDLEIKNDDINAQKIELQELKKQLEHRLMVAGSDIETIEDGEGKIQVIHAEAVQYGSYNVLMGNIPETIEKSKARLVENLAKAMIDQNIVQFIINDNLFGDYVTVAAKFFVIPWEQMRTRKIEIRREL